MLPCSLVCVTHLAKCILAATQLHTHPIANGAPCSQTRSGCALVNVNLLLIRAPAFLTIMSNCLRQLQYKKPFGIVFTRRDGAALAIIPLSHPRRRSSIAPRTL
ncbi:hypothetical protein R3P38DRAFT_2894510 [Favolaschia claudopus]|uniref:Secreted protein n=1 Tax=Favolaschia claudopus TaxID=2862362 RepID=A0AAW0CMR5_9AGAR